ncbi:cupin domain-containing protein [Tardiphaga alba]|uniref:Cupin domain-containing protein n=1 Tax=Tardiphaga alba TaxID=340268 RepID=A0ABX8A4F8_9BRAD|nr:cupin domain-containing protein [Tardiphaga alba]QUS38503.1 cupin domain-containing protein [Tardiphaga alba]
MQLTQLTHLLATTCHDDLGRVVTKRKKGTAMTSNTIRAAIIDHPADVGYAVTSWGERARTRIPASSTSGPFVLMDYYAPAGFGPPRHIHRADDEFFIVQSGTIAVWSETESHVAKPGDVVILPKRIAHAWRSYGEDEVHLHVIVSPGDFECFFREIEKSGLAITDVGKLSAIAELAEIDIIGPPLSDADMATILNAAQHSMPEKRSPVSPESPDFWDRLREA